MKQRALIILVAILGATCIVLGIFLLRGGKRPETADPTPEATATPTATPEAESSASTDSAVPYVSPIDFASLQEENPDIYAWLRIPGTEFDFPILQRAGDDDYYLTHDSDGNDNSMGAIFSESSYNDGKMDDPATVLYGHQMLAGQCLASCSRSIPNRMRWRSTAISPCICRKRKCTTRCLQLCRTITATFCIRMISRASADTMRF